MKNIRKSFCIILLLTLPFVFSMQQKKTDYEKLGKGRLVCTDKTIKKNIILKEIRFSEGRQAGWIVYIKDGSLHDMPIEKVEYIEFKETEKGPVKMRIKETGEVLFSEI